jgi:hypothetical protein
MGGPGTRVLWPNRQGLRAASGAGRLDAAMLAPRASWAGSARAGTPERRQEGWLRSPDGDAAGHAFPGVAGDRAQVLVASGRGGGEGEGSRVHPGSSWLTEEPQC